MTTLREMLDSEQTTMDEIAAWLDRVSPDARIEATFALGRKGQSLLYQRAAAAPPITFEHFVPRDVPDVSAVHHKGRNTLPVAERDTYFEKRFARPNDGSERLFGYNQAGNTKLVGPGYFVVSYTKDNPRWSERAAVVVDCHKTPDGPVPPEWPKVVPNARGIVPRLVFNYTRDFMRRVSQHVSIGAATWGDLPIGSYFVLVRQDP
jgi:hypothetical protein